MLKYICSSILILFFCLSAVETCLGSSDETFIADAATEVEARVFPQFITSEGKIIITGQFNVINGVKRNGIARLNQDGSIDPTFSVDTNNFFLGNGFPSNIRVAAAQPDGKILIGGSFSVVNGVSRFAIARLNQDGSLDASFAPDTLQDNNNYVSSIVPLTSGKILVGGFSVNINGVTRSLARLNSDGSLDSAFENSITGVNKIVVQSDGKILLIANGSLKRLTADGFIEDSFNPVTSGGITDIGLQPDQKIVISGSFDRVNNSNRDSIARLNGDGSLDAALNTDLTMLCCRSPVINALIVQADGKILIGGVFDNINGVPRSDVARINYDGTLDTSFSPNIRSYTTSGDNYEVSSLRLSPDGKVVIGGYFPKVENSFRSNIAKLNIVDGTLDNTFDSVIGRRSAVKLVKVQPDGKVLVGGDFTIINDKRARYITRLTQNGGIDEGFKPDNQAIAGITTFELDSDNKILVGGFFVNQTNSTVNYITRLNTDGTFDTSFSAVVNQNVTAISRQPDNKILIGGKFNRVNNTNRFSFARLNSNGTTDTSLPSINFFNGSSAGLTINKIATQADGKILVGGQFQQVNSISKIGVARINTDGSLDTSFATNLTASSPTDIIVYDLTALSNGKILVVGFLGTNNDGTRRRFAQFNQDGSNDPSFNPVSIPFVIPYKILIQNNGKILIGAYTDSLYSNSGIIRLSSNGSLDETLNIGSGANRAVYSLDQISDNKLIAVGEFTEFNGFTHFGIVKISLSGGSKFDYDGDGKSDISVFRPSNGIWYLQQSTAGFGGVQFGANGDKLVPADYDGDGKTDVAVYRDGQWYLQRTMSGFTNIAFGQTGDVPVAADFDGDGRSDLGVYRASSGQWFIQRSTAGFYAIQFGINGDVPMPGDFDGDGKSDLALFRPSNGIWYILGSTQGFYGVQFGATGDKLVPADYDGDGKTDLAVFRPSNATWYINRSQLGSTNLQFGVSTDLPVPADYDGDGKADVAVYRNDTWFIQRSAAGFTGVQFGSTSDQPIPNAYVR